MIGWAGKGHDRSVVAEGAGWKREHFWKKSIQIY